MRAAFAGFLSPPMQSVSSPYPTVVRAYAHIISKLFFASTKNQPEVKQNWLHFLPPFWKNKSVVCLGKLPRDPDGWIGLTWNYCDIWLKSKLTDVQGWQACFYWLIFIIFLSIIPFYHFQQRVDQYFTQINKIIKARITSSRVRFMMQDVVDLRNNDWVPCREDNNPKTFAQIYKEVGDKGKKASLRIQQEKKMQRGKFVTLSPDLDAMKLSEWVVLLAHEKIGKGTKVNNVPKP